MIFYCIQSHGDAGAMLDWLIARLDHPGNRLLVTHDGPQAEALAATLRQPSNCSLAVRRSRPVTYCGYSNIEALLDAVAMALEADAGWRYLINLSAQCLPIKSHAALLARLEGGAAAGRCNFIHTFRTRATRHPADIAPANTASPGEMVRVAMSRPSLYADPDLAQLLEQPGCSPLTNIALRTALHYEEIAGERGLRVRRLSESERRERDAFFATWPHFCGRAWYVLERETCEVMLRSLGEPGNPFEEAFRTMLVPDESTIQTWLANHPILRERSYLKDNLRFRGGAPTVLGIGHLPELAASPAFFARKRPPRMSPELAAGLMAMAVPASMDAI